MQGKRRGRPPKSAAEKRELVMLGTRVPPALKRRLTAAALYTGTSAQHIVETALESALAAMETAYKKAHGKLYPIPEE